MSCHVSIVCISRRRIRTCQRRKKSSKKKGKKSENIEESEDIGDQSSAQKPKDSAQATDPANQESVVDPIEEYRTKSKYY